MYGHCGAEIRTRGPPAFGKLAAEIWVDRDGVTVPRHRATPRCSLT